MVRSNHLMKFALCKKAVRLTKGGGYYLIHSEVLLIDSTNLFFTLGSQNCNWSTLKPSKSTCTPQCVSAGAKYKSPSSTYSIYSLWLAPHSHLVESTPFSDVGIVLFTRSGHFPPES